VPAPAAAGIEMNKENGNVEREFGGINLISKVKALMRMMMLLQKCAHM
jgi:hypothetical protein